MSAFFPKLAPEKPAPPTIPLHNGKTERLHDAH